MNHNVNSCVLTSWYLNPNRKPEDSKMVQPLCRNKLHSALATILCLSLFAEFTCLAQNSVTGSLSAGSIPPQQLNSSTVVPAPTFPANATDPMSQDLPNPNAAPEEEKVSIDFRQTPLGDVLRMLADATQINLIVGKSVQQDLPVTIKLNDVTYRTALSAVLEMFGLEPQIKNNRGDLKIPSLRGFIKNSA